MLVTLRATCGACQRAVPCPCLNSRPPLAQSGVPSALHHLKSLQSHCLVPIMKSGRGLEGRAGSWGCPSSSHALKYLKSQPFPPVISSVSSDSICKKYYQGQSLCFEISAATKEVIFATHKMQLVPCHIPNLQCTVQCAPLPDV